MSDFSTFSKGRGEAHKNVYSAAIFYLENAYLLLQVLHRKYFSENVWLFPRHVLTFAPALKPVVAVSK